MSKTFPRSTTECLELPFVEIIFLLFNNQDFMHVKKQLLLTRY